MDVKKTILAKTWTQISAGEAWASVIVSEATGQTPVFFTQNPSKPIGDEMVTPISTVLTTSSGSKVVSMPVGSHLWGYAHEDVVVVYSPGA